MILSLIIPIFNVEKYILECLQSVAKNLPQDNVEIILVNDGSPDRSMQIVDDFLKSLDEKLSSHFNVINQENQGLSAARNIGIKNSTGEYIGFLDSDDILNENALNEVISLLQYKKYDLIDFNIHRINDSGVRTDFLKPIMDQGAYDLNTDVLKLIFNQSAWYAWKRVYKRDLFRDIDFPVGVNFEDAYTVPFIYLKAKSIYVSHFEIIGYRFNPNGITQTMSEKNLQDLRNASIKLSKYIESYPFVISSVLSLCRFYINNVIEVKGCWVGYREWKKISDDLRIYENKHYIYKFSYNFRSIMLVKLGYFFIYFVYLKNKILN